MLEIDLRQYGMERLQRMPAVVERIVKESATMVWHEMLKHVPYKTGFLRGSVQPHRIGRYHMVVGPTAIYGRAVDQGLPGGPGRYVPAIGKRLTKSGRGWWPGFKGAFFIQKTYDKAVRQIPMLARQILEDHFYGGMV